LSEMVGRRVRESGFLARTLQLKLRYSDFTTITRARTIAKTSVDNEIASTIREPFLENWERGRSVRLLGVHASHFGNEPEQMDLLGEDQRQKWARALSASDKLRDKYGETAVFLAKGMKGVFRERGHENPAEKPKKKPVKKS
jgi:DNA polymerase IV